jgi:hypothetical protein
VQQLKSKLESLSKSDIAHKAHYDFAIERIKNPGTITLPSPVVMAPGAPIGCDMD